MNILLVEDNPGDVRLMKESLKGSNMANRLYVLDNGEDVMPFLRKEGRFADAVRPGLIFLDLNLPRKNGREVLSEIKADPDLRRIPVVVLTSSRDEEDVLRSYDLHANCFVQKPVGLEQFVTVVRSVERFWFAIVELPDGR